MTHRENVLQRFRLPTEHPSLGMLARASGVSESILQQVYNRGVGAWKSNPTSVRLKGSFAKDRNPAIPRSARLPKEQWAMARVYSFLDKGTTYRTADADLARRAGY